jgi:hypothetical protein
MRGALAGELERALAVAAPDLMARLRARPTGAAPGAARAVRAAAPSPRAPDPLDALIARAEARAEEDDA